MEETKKVWKSSKTRKPINEESNNKKFILPPKESLSVSIEKLEPIKKKDSSPASPISKIIEQKIQRKKRSGSCYLPFKFLKEMEQLRQKSGSFKSRTRRHSYILKPSTKEISYIQNTSTFSTKSDSSDKKRPSSPFFLSKTKKLDYIVKGKDSPGFNKYFLDNPSTLNRKRSGSIVGSPQFVSKTKRFEDKTDSLKEKKKRKKEEEKEEEGEKEKKKPIKRKKYKFKKAKIKEMKYYVDTCGNGKIYIDPKKYSQFNIPKREGSLSPFLSKTKSFLFKKKDSPGPSKYNFTSPNFRKVQDNVDSVSFGSSSNRFNPKIAIYKDPLWM